MAVISRRPVTDCGHGAPDFDSSEEEGMYTAGLESTLHCVNKYLEQGSNSAGKKAAEKLKKVFPQLVTLEMIHLLASEATKLWLASDTPDVLVIQGLAEVIGKLEEELKGYSTTKEELRKSFNKSSGLREATPRSLKKFLVARVPCQCLQPHKQRRKESNDVGSCYCGVRRPLHCLHACAGCRSVVYCSVECQRSDWPVHSQDCQRLARARKAQMAIDTTQALKEQESRSFNTIYEDDERSLVPDDLISEDEEGGSRGLGSAESFGFDDLIGEIEDLLGESDEHLGLHTSLKRLKKSPRPKKRSSNPSNKLHASTSLIPSILEMEKEREKLTSKSPSRKTSFRSSTSRLKLSSSISSVDSGKRRKKKEVEK